MSTHPVRLALALLLAGALTACGDDEPDEPTDPPRTYEDVAPSFCQDLDPASLLAEAAPGLTWEVSPEEIVDLDPPVRPVVCTFDGTDPDAPDFRTIPVEGDPAVHVTYLRQDSDDEARECFEEEVAALEEPALGGSVPASASGWWEEGRRQVVSTSLDSGLPVGESPAAVGSSRVEYVLRDANACLTVAVDDTSFDADDTQRRLDRGEEIARLLLDALPAHLPTS